MSFWKPRFPRSRLPASRTVAVVATGAKVRSFAWVTLCALSGCASGALGDLADAGAGDAQPAGEENWRKPPAGSVGPAGDPVGGVDSPQAPPSAKPPEGACGVIDAAGICKGAVAFWCEAGALVTEDCRALGTACVFDDALGGFRCEGAFNDDPGPADPPPGAPEPGDPGAPEAPPPDDDEAPPPADPPEEGEPPPPDAPDDGEPLPPDAPSPPDDPAGDACGGIDYLGECQGDLAVWCDAGSLQSVDCTQFSTPCGWVDDTTGFYCLPAAPDAPDPGPEPAPDPAPEPVPEPDPGVPPPVGGCDLGFTGECQADLARFCAGDTLIETDCAARGQVCGFISDAVGYYCMSPVDPADPVEPAEPVDACGGIDYLGECRGDTVVWCDNAQLYQIDCAAQGEFCGWISDAGGYFCTSTP